LRVGFCGCEDKLEEGRHEIVVDDDDEHNEVDDDDDNDVGLENGG